MLHVMHFGALFDGKCRHPLRLVPEPRRRKPTKPFSRPTSRGTTVDDGSDGGRGGSGVFMQGAHWCDRVAVRLRWQEGLFALPAHAARLLRRSPYGQRPMQAAVQRGPCTALQRGPYTQPICSRQVMLWFYPRASTGG